VCRCVVVTSGVGACQCILHFGLQDALIEDCVMATLEHFADATNVPRFLSSTEDEWAGRRRGFVADPRDACEATPLEIKVACRARSFPLAPAGSRDDVTTRDVGIKTSVRSLRRRTMTMFFNSVNLSK